MAEKVQARRVFDPPSSHLSYVVSITLPQPTIRIRIPKMLVKAIQKRNQTRTENEEKGNKTRKKILAGKSFRKKVGSMFSNVFGKKKSPETNSKAENGELDSNGQDDGMENLRKMVARLDMESENITTKKTFEEFILHDPVQEMAAAVATDEGKERPEPVVIKEMAKSGYERKERPKLRRTFLRRTDLELMNTGRINNVDDSSTVKNTFGEFILHDAVTDEGKERSVVIKEMAKPGYERKERPKSRRTFLRRTDMELMSTGRIDNVDDSGTVGITNTGISVRPKSRRTFLKRTDLELMSIGRINNVDDSDTAGITNTGISVSCVGDEGANAVEAKAMVSVKQAEISNDSLTRIRLSSPRKPKIAWSKKKMNSVLVGGRSERQELCKKRILMGDKCRPLNHSGIIPYDENGVFLPDIIPW